MTGFSISASHAQTAIETGNADSLIAIIGRGEDTVYGSNYAYGIAGFDGDDMLCGYGGDDGIFGDAGSDTIVGGSGNDNPFGGSGVDLLEGGAGADYLHRGSSLDVALYLGASGGVIADLVRSGYNTGDARGDIYVSIESLGGTAFGDVLACDDGANAIFGNGGNDLVGRSGNDRLFGGSGNDTLRGDSGQDMLTGGKGADIFVFNKGSGKDTVTDFGGNDVLRIENGANRMSDLKFTDTKAGLLVEFGSVDVFLKVLDRGDLTASDFDFV